MARIEGVDLPRNKRVEIGLRYLYGIGPTRAKAILNGTQVNPDTRVKDLTDAEVAQLEADRQVAEAAKAERDAEEAAKAAAKASAEAKLSALGLSAEEIAALSK